jgi:hypothetical protein
MKRIFTIIAIAGMFALTACGQGNNQAETESTEQEAEQMMEEMDSEMEEVVEEVVEEVDSTMTEMTDSTDVEEATEEAM